MPMLLGHLLITLYTLLTFGNVRTAMPATPQPDSTPMAAELQHTDSHEDYLHGPTLADIPRGMAIIEPNSNGYRLGSSRPQRLLPTSPAKHKQTTGRFPTHRFYIQKTHQHTFGGRFVATPAPFQPSASCDYYVIALRHIIR